MTPETLARLHAVAMTVPAPWKADDFRALLAQHATFLVTPSTRKYPGESARGAAPLSPAATTPSAQHLMGFALGRVVSDEAELLTLAVDPDLRRRGLGLDLLSRFETEAARLGAAQAHLEVAATNTPALALYRGAGWTECGLRKAYYKGPDARIDAILMTKRLAAD